jgi:hypothetical protein
MTGSIESGADLGRLATQWGAADNPTTIALTGDILPRNCLDA